MIVPQLRPDFRCFRRRSYGLWPVLPTDRRILRCNGSRRTRQCLQWRSSQYILYLPRGNADTRISFLHRIFRGQLHCMSSLLFLPHLYTLSPLLIHARRRRRSRSGPCNPLMNSQKGHNHLGLSRPSKSFRVSDISTLCHWPGLCFDGMGVCRYLYQYEPGS